MNVGRYLVLLLLPLVWGTIYVSNDVSWRTPYLLGYYATLSGNTFFALDSRDTAENILPFFLEGTTEEVVVYESATPVMRNYEQYLRARGITNVRTVRYDRLEDIMMEFPETFGVDSDVVVMVAEGGEWLLPAAAMAFSKGARLYIINNRTIEDLLGVEGREVYIIGYEGKRLRDKGRVIATGDRIKDAIEVAKLIPEWDTVLIMSGLFLYVPPKPEKTLYFTGAGGNPILISYTDRVPEEVVNVIKEKKPGTVVFVGPDVARAREVFKTENPDIRTLAFLFVRYSGIPTRSPTANFTPPYILLPSSDIRLQVESSSLLSDRLFLKLRNTGTSPLYYIVTSAEISCDTEERLVAMENPRFLGGGEQDFVELSFDPLPSNKRCAGVVNIIYGPDRTRMGELNEWRVRYTFEGVPTSVEGDVNIEVTMVFYSKRLERVFVEMKNTGEKTVYAFPRVKLIIDGIQREFRGNQVSITPGSTARSSFRVYLSEADLFDNREVDVVVVYGPDPNSPTSSLYVRKPLEDEPLIEQLVYLLEENALIVGVVVLILLILLILRRR